MPNDEFDKQIINIQKSTKTSFGIILPLHNSLRMRSKWYYNWHLNPWASKLHKGILSLYIVFITAFVFMTVFSKTNSEITYASGLTCASVAAGSWDSANTWEDSSCGGLDGIPGTGDNVTITHQVTLGGNIDIGTGDITINGGGTLITSGYNMTLHSMAVNTSGVLTASTVGGRNSTINVSGSWDHFAGTFTETGNTSTVNMTGTGTIKGKLSYNTSKFNNLSIATAGTTTVLNSIQTGTLTIGAGPVSTPTAQDYYSIFISGSGSPLTSMEGGTVTRVTLTFFANSVTLPKITNYYGISFSPSSGSAGNDNATMTLSDDIVITGPLRASSSISNTRGTIDLAGHEVTIGQLLVGTGTLTLGKVKNSAPQDTSIITMSNSVSFADGQSTYFNPDNVIDGTNINFVFNLISSPTIWDNKDEENSFEANNSTVEILTSPLEAGKYKNPIINVGNGITFNNFILNNTNSHTPDPPYDILTVRKNYVSAQNPGTAGDLKVAGNLTITDGVLDLSGGSNVNVAGSVIIETAGSVTKGSGTWTFDGTEQNLQANSQNLGNVVISPSSTVTQSSSVTIDTLTTSGIWNASASMTINNNIEVVAGTFNAGSQTITISGDLLLTGGTLNGLTGNIKVAGNWNKSGSAIFTAGTGTVELTGAGGSTQTITGNATFNNLTIAATTARNISFTAGSETTVSGLWTVTGILNQLITLTTSSAPTTWSINPTSVNITYANINYSINTSNNLQCAVYSQSANGNNTNWNITNESVCPSYPNPPSSLSQTKTDNSAIEAGNWTKENTIKFSVTGTNSAAPGTLYLCIEKDLIGTNFSGTEDSCSEGFSYVGSPITLTHQIFSITDGNYHWNARIKNSENSYSSWISFGENVESATDFSIDQSPPASFTPSASPSTWTKASEVTITFATTDSGSGINKYEIKIDNGNFTETANPFTLPTAELSDGEHLVTVKATDSVENYIEGVATIYINKEAPANVSNLEASVYTIGDKIVLAWNNPSDEDFIGVKIQRSTDGYPLTHDDGTNIYQGNSQSFTDECIETDTEYFYTVFSYDNLDNYSSGSITSLLLPGANAADSSDTDNTESTDEIDDTETTSESDDTDDADGTNTITEDTAAQTENQVEISQSLNQTLAESIKLSIREKSNLITLTNSSQYHILKGQTMIISLSASSLPKPAKTIIARYNRSSYLLKQENDTYTAIISAGQDSGDFDLIIDIVFDDDTMSTITVQTTIDPLGYVFYKKKSFWDTTLKKNGYEEVRIKDAKITLYVFSDENKQWEVWKDKINNQANSQYTNQSGEYSFFVEPGKYYILIEKDGFKSVKTDEFKVEQDVVIRNVEISKDIPTLEWFGTILIITSLLNFISWIMNKRTRKKTVSQEIESMLWNH